MKIMQETTQWSDGSQANHIYVFNDSMTKAVAYVPRGSNRVFKFKNPLAIDTRGRTFEELDDSPSEPDSRVIEVLGSKGEKYYLSDEGQGRVCTCPGYRFRGTCKHVAEQQQP